MTNVIQSKGTLVILIVKNTCGHQILFLLLRRTPTSRLLLKRARLIIQRPVVKETTVFEIYLQGTGLSI